MKKDSRMLKIVMIFLIGISLSLAGQCKYVYAGQSNKVVIIGGDHLDTTSGYDLKAANVMCVGSGGYLPVTGAELEDFDFSAMSLSNLTEATIAPYDTAVLNMGSYEIGCAGNLNYAQRSAIDAFLAAGNKLIIYDAQCTSTINYSWLPYSFTSAKPSSTCYHLAIAEDNTLSSSNPSDASFIDTDALVSNTDAARKMRVMDTTNSNWHIDIVGTNYSGAPIGVGHAYATYPEDTDKGLIIYNALSLTSMRPISNADPNLKKIWILELKQSFNRSNLPGTAPVLGIRLDQINSSSLVGGTHIVTATLTDMLGDPLKNVQVYFSVTGINSGAFGTFTPANRMTDANGEISFSYSDKDGEGTDAVRAYFKDGSGRTVYSNTLNVTWKLKVLEINLEPDGSSSVTGVNEDHTVTATVTDQSDGSLQVNIPIDFLVISGPNSGTDNASGTCIPADCMTDDNGMVSFNYLDEGGKGVDEIQACFSTPGSTSGTCSNIVTHEWSNNVVITLTQSSSSSKLNQSHTVTATLKNELQVPQSGTKITFSFTGVNASAAHTYNPTTCITNSNGQVTCTYTGTKEGTDHINACFADAPGSTKCAQVNMEWTSTPSPTSGFLLPDNGVSILNGTHTVTAVLTDSLDDPLVGTVVTFKVTGANYNATGTYSPSDKKTDTNGMVAFTYTGTTLGKDTIEGCYNTSQGDEICSHVTTQWIEFTKIKLDPEVASKPAGGEHTITATLTDLLNNPREGVTVNFLITDGPNENAGDTVLTDPDGKASFIYSSNGDEGTDKIEASFTDGSCAGSAQAENEWTPDVIANAHVTLEGTVTADGSGFLCPNSRVKTNNQYFPGTILTDSVGHYSWTSASVPPCGDCQVRGLVNAQWDIQGPDGKNVHFEGSSPFSFENPTRFFTIPCPPVDIDMSRVW